MNVKTRHQDSLMKCDQSTVGDSSASATQPARQKQGLSDDRSHCDSVMSVSSHHLQQQQQAQEETDQQPNRSPQQLIAPLWHEGSGYADERLSAAANASHHQSTHQLTPAQMSSLHWASLAAGACSWQFQLPINLKMAAVCTSTTNDHDDEVREDRGINSFSTDDQVLHSDTRGMDTTAAASEEVELGNGAVHQQRRCSDFSIARLLADTGCDRSRSRPRQAGINSHPQRLTDDDGEDRLGWVNCSRYKPPKLSRCGRDGIPVKRRLGRNPRIPFSPQQIALLEHKFRMKQYLSSSDVNELADVLCLTHTRVKIWFQNRRARERRENENRLCSKPEHSTCDLATGNSRNCPNVFDDQSQGSNFLSAANVGQSDCSNFLPAVSIGQSDCSNYQRIACGSQSPLLNAVDHRVSAFRPVLSACDESAALSEIDTKMSAV